MTLREMASQVLMVGVGGSTGLSPQSVDFLASMNPGAVLFFAFNVSASTDDVAALTASICEAASLRGIDPFIAIDHEGGTVFRFKGGVSLLPSAHSIGAEPDAARRANLAGKIAGSELRALGISMNLAPVVESSSGPAAEFLAFRSWSADAKEAGKLAGLFLAACQKAGTACAAKHFPGTAAADPHSALAVLPVNRRDFDALYLAPFKKALESDPALVMMSHVVVPCIDEANPAPLSKAMVTGLLKGRLGFEGIVVSDDLAMKALAGAGGMEVRAVAALAAGVDMVMISGGADLRKIRAAIVAATESGTIPKGRLEDAVFRIIRQKLAFRLVGDTAQARMRRYLGFADLVARNTNALSGVKSLP